MQPRLESGDQFAVVEESMAMTSIDDTNAATPNSRPADDTMGHTASAKPRDVFEKEGSPRLPLRIFLCDKIERPKARQLRALIRKHGGVIETHFGKADCIVVDVLEPIAARKLLRQSMHMGVPIPVVTTDHIQRSAAAGKLEEYMSIDEEVLTAMIETPSTSVNLIAHRGRNPFTEQEIDVIIDYFASLGRHKSINSAALDIAVKLPTHTQLSIQSFLSANFDRGMNLKERVGSRIRENVTQSQRMRNITQQAQNATEPETIPQRQQSSAAQPDVSVPQQQEVVRETEPVTRQQKLSSSQAHEEDELRISRPTDTQTSATDDDEELQVRAPRPGAAAPPAVQPPPLQRSESNADGQGQQLANPTTIAPFRAKVEQEDPYQGLRTETGSTMPNHRTSTTSKYVDDALFEPQRGGPSLLKSKHPNGVRKSVTVPRFSDGDKDRLARALIARTTLGPFTEAEREAYIDDPPSSFWETFSEQNKNHSVAEWRTHFLANNEAYKKRIRIETGSDDESEDEGEDELESQEAERAERRAASARRTSASEERAQTISRAREGQTNPSTRPDDAQRLSPELSESVPDARPLPLDESDSSDDRLPSPPPPEEPDSDDELRLSPPPQEEADASDDSQEEADNVDELLQTPPPQEEVDDGDESAEEADDDDEQLQSPPPREEADDGDQSQAEADDGTQALQTPPPQEEVEDDDEPLPSQPAREETAVSDDQDAPRRDLRKHIDIDDEQIDATTSPHQGQSMVIQAQRALSASNSTEDRRSVSSHASGADGATIQRRQRKGDKDRVTDDEILIASPDKSIAGVPVLKQHRDVTFMDFSVDDDKQRSRASPSSSLQDGADERRKRRSRNFTFFNDDDAPRERPSRNTSFYDDDSERRKRQRIAASSDAVRVLPASAREQIPAQVRSKARVSNASTRFNDSARESRRLQSEAERYREQFRDFCRQCELDTSLAKKIVINFNANIADAWKHLDNWCDTMARYGLARARAIKYLKAAKGDFAIAEASISLARA